MVLPLSAYALLAVSEVAAFRYPVEAQFAVAAATLMLLFAGIRNVWDAVTGTCWCGGFFLKEPAG